MNKLKQLLEARGKSLERLGDMTAIDVLAEFPVEAIRLFFRKFEKEIFKIEKDDKKEIIRNLRSSVHDSMNPTNLLFKYRYEMLINPLNNSMGMTKVAFKIKENRLYWGINISKVGIDPDEMKPLKLTNQSLNSVYDIIIEKIAEASKFGPKYRGEKEDYEKALAYAGSQHREKLSIIKKLKPLSKKFHFNLEAKKRSELTKFVKFRAKNYFIAGSTNEKYFHSFNHKLMYRFQVEELKKFIKLLDKRLKANNYFVNRINILGNDEGVYFQAEHGDPKSKLTGRTSTLEHFHNKKMEDFYKRLDMWSFDNVEEITREEAYRIVMKRVFKN